MRADTSANLVLAGPGLQLNNSGLTNAVGLTQLSSPSRLNVSQAARLQGSLYLNEQASADTNLAGNGQIWVQTDTPNRLKFTDDSDQDFDVAMVGGYVNDNVFLNSSRNYNSAGNFAANNILYFDDGGADTVTLEDSGSTTNWPVYTSIQLICPGSNTVTITEGSGTTLFLQDGTDTVGGGSLSQGAATIFRASTTDYIYIGDGFTT